MFGGHMDGINEAPQLEENEVTDNMFVHGAPELGHLDETPF